MLRRIDAVIAGAGISGLTVARGLAEKGKKVIVVEQSRNIGGHCFDYVNDHGILIQPYGPHIFHTDNKEVWDFLSRFTEWNPYHHSVGGFIDGQLIPIPFNLNTLHKLLPMGMAGRIEEKLLSAFPLGTRVPILKLKESDDRDLKFLAQFVYEKIFLNYTLKQWGGRRPEDLDSSVSSRVPVVISRDDRYFNDAYQGIPLKGFSVMMQQMADHPNIHLLLNTDVNEFIRIDDKNLLLNGHPFEGQYIYTGPIDELFDCCYGSLPYRSLKIDIESFPYEGSYQARGVINYPNNYDFTRITEFKHFQRTLVNQHTTIGREYPQSYVKGKNQPFYVIDNEENRNLYKLYKAASDRVPHLTCLGRLGEYRYYDIDEAVEVALQVVKEL